ncbi:hypothetical protein VB264_02090 [Arcicella aquatica]|uniref:Periplasmic protein n=1 Tax=Arcicella aquatica TaxID=217141 RepID=A0ABU5QIG6_9BACT|nr:hypothetical protein [Arcicella aquatica]MEA5256554.1 hypothetical protein [Arcicella aquatica]
MKIIKLSALLLLLSGFVYNANALAEESGSGTIIVCPGTGVSCVVKAPNGTVTSEKDKDKAAVVVQQ